jgi:hypothetical protein
LPFGRRETPLMDIALLPTLARPFYVRRVTLTTMNGGCVPTGPGATIELRRTMHLPPAPAALAFSFLMPTAVAPAPARSAAPGRAADARIR